ncbi:type II secretion system protein E [Methanocorpusculaceae archaeon]|nr:type II secretion system protein E [Methanocorpusculaceae archaeon]MBO5118441.1 type II secretion system protein E [Methanocorpusculum sp.]MBO5367011.1 type II secretion system protein E [Methanocorpusculum sp.]MBO5431043.1 type II secretion system protein E [Methanocorpusculum sp.]MBP3443526.1 type II secretion system protein E [Methanocorpusculaceae archaeon]
MALRLSFTLDAVLSERIDQFAKKQEIDRNEAVLLLLEYGLDQAAEAGVVEPIRDRDFKKEARLQKNIDSITGGLDDLRKEVRSMHHLLNMSLKNTEKKTPRRGLFK